MKLKYCYWCGKQATSMEHIPPKCLFPEKKDVEAILNKSYRNNLITVPSCDEHNLRKSHNDEYLMVHLASVVGNNSLAYLHTQTKVKRSLEYNRNLIDIERKGIIANRSSIFPVLIVNADSSKLIHSFESIARGLYYHEFHKVFKGKVTIISTLLKHPEYPDASVFIDESLHLIKREQKYWLSEVKGNNPEVFTYQISPTDDLGTFTIFLKFYESIEVYIIMSSFTKEDELMLKPLSQSFLNNAIKRKNEVK